MTVSSLTKNIPFSAISFTQTVLNQAVKQGASDVHIEPQAYNYRIRLRVDGLLQELLFLTQVEAHTVRNHLKILARLDIAEHRLPQDGHFHFKSEPSSSKECRLSVCPSVHGEKLVIRLLQNAEDLPPLENLGFEPFALKLFQAALTKAQGLILVTGPTGSGKTISLYHALSLLNKPERNIISIEDPVEIKLAGITQVNVNPSVGLNFSTALRSLLRQDPDIIMLGEIRDAETAEMAIKAAQTGHLILATLHTHSALASIDRLIHLGISAYALVNSLTLVIGQRLVRTLCLHCPSKENENLKAVGCTECHQGYRGRTGIYEIFSPTQALQRAILEGTCTEALEVLAQQGGFKNLQQAAHAKLKAGITTAEEIKRVLG